jgi:hypothetical protein
LINEFISSHPSHQFRPQLEAYQSISEFIARDESMQTLVKRFEDQVVREPSDDVGFVRFTLTALAGAPGDGKSRFLDQLYKAQRLFDLARQWIPEHADAFSPDNTCVVNVTFNHKTPKVPVETSFECMITARLLFQHVFDIFHVLLHGLDHFDML